MDHSLSSVEDSFISNVVHSDLADSFEINETIFNESKSFIENSSFMVNSDSEESVVVDESTDIDSDNAIGQIKTTGSKATATSSNKLLNVRKSLSPITHGELDESGESDRIVKQEDSDSDYSIVEPHESSAIQIIDSSDESTGNSKPLFAVKREVELNVKREAMLEKSVQFQTDVKLETLREGVKIKQVEAAQAGVSLQSGVKKNPLQILDDIKPVHTGKTGMETFNTQQSMARNLMENIFKSLDVKPNEDDFAENPKQLKIELMPHQKHALSWMLWREKQSPRGGILADDMGLGKTMSMISLVVRKRFDENEAETSNQSSDSSDDENESKENKPSWIAKGSAARSYYYGGTLVVCPASVMDQWKNEIKNRLKSNTLSVILHHGGNRETRPRSLCKHDVVITTYGIVSSECENQGVLFSVKWERIILDEAHIIRNHSCKQSIACCKLKGSARWALTGTPIQNKEQDLYALLKFLRCRPLDDYSSFKMWISKTSSKSQERLNQVLQALLLRRTKDDLIGIGQIASLPEKTIEIVPVKLTTDEMNVYQKVMFYSQNLFSQFLHQRETRNNFSVETNSEQKQEWAKLHEQVSKIHGASHVISAHHILILILRLRQICIHPTLIDSMLVDATSDDDDSDRENLPEVDLLEQLSKLQIGSNIQDEENVSKASSKVLLRTNSVFDERRMSSKFQKLIECISEKIIGSSDKGIVVSQFTSVLNMLGDHLKKMGIRFVMLTGQTKITSRNDIVTDFNNSNSSTKVMLLSLTAGGVGLNLCGANHLFFIDPHWNPQLERQAQDRIYRIGQKKSVTIYKFLCDDTIERRIQHLQEQKLEIATQVLTGAKRTSSKLTIQDMKSLFDM